MKTRLLAGATVVLVMLSSTAFADSDHHKGDGSSQGMPGMMMSGGMPMMNMDAMHEHMTKMQKTMEQIQGAGDAKARQDLMQQHMKEMQEGMGMMQGMMSDNMPKKMMGQMGGEHKMPGKIKGPGPRAMMDDDAMENSETLTKRHNMMKQRMDMMQGMMGQMMEHMMQQQKMGMGNK
jgi:hypothetical protein